MVFFEEAILFLEHRLVEALPIQDDKLSPRMIEVERVSRRFGETLAVDDVSLRIERGTITVLVGTSGSGKSTLLRMINRLIEPSAGRVLIEGKDTRSEPAHLLRRRIGYAIQGHGLS